MVLTGHDHNADAQPLKAERLLVNKEYVIKALQDLIDQYPSDEIPLDVVKQTLAKFIGIQEPERLKNNPSIEKLDKVLAQFKTPRSP